MPTRSSRLPYVAALIWLAFTVSLASWWLSLGLTVADRARMFAWEGGTFILVLIAGGVAIVVAINREQRRRETVETFFLSFTHDMKTALARVQLQAEGLREDWPDGAPGESLDRLLQDTLRLQIQLENSLFVAQPDGRLLEERLDVVEACARLADDWPGLTVEVSGNGLVRADARAFHTVLRNLLQNSVIHGGATRVTIRVDTPTAERVVIQLTDDGGGVPADRVARLSWTPVGTAAGGSGIGLVVCRQIVTRMGGLLRFARSAGGGLTVTIELPRATS